MNAATDRKAVLNELADAELELRREAEESERERADQLRFEKERRRGWERARRELEGGRQTAVVKCERLARQLAEALREVHSLAEAEGEVLGNLGTPRPGLKHPSLARRLSRYLGEILQTLPGASAGRYGNLVLPNIIRPGASWVESEKQALGEGKANGDAKDDSEITAESGDELG